MRRAGRPPTLVGAPGLAPAAQLVAAVLIAGLMATLSIAVRWASRPTAVKGHPYVSLYDPPRTRAEAMLVEGDGQAYAALAQDPLLSRPDVFSATGAGERPAQEAAYRAARPLLGWLAWAGSLGRARRVPMLLLGLTVLGAMALVAGVATTAAELRRRAELSALAVLLPGSLALLGSTGPEAFGTGLALIGAVSWWRERRLLGVAAMAAAALARETLVIVPLAIAVVELRERRLRWPLCIPPLLLAAWDLVDRARYGYFPWAAGRGRLSAPWTSLGAVARWSAADAAVAIGGLVLVAVGVRRLPLMWRAIVAGYIALAFVMGPDVWAGWWAFSRPLLPLYAIALVGCLPLAAAVAQPRPPARTLLQDDRRPLGADGGVVAAGVHRRGRP